MHVNFLLLFFAIMERTGTPDPKNKIFLSSEDKIDVKLANFAAFIFV